MLHAVTAVEAATFAPMAAMTPPRAPDFGERLNCSLLVKPMDMSPKLVHAFLSAVFRGRDVVEVGSRLGDGLHCWSRTARSSIGVEDEHEYCKRLNRELRAKKTPNSTLLCRSLFDQTPDADIYTWLQQVCSCCSQWCPNCASVGSV